MPFIDNWQQFSVPASHIYNIYSYTHPYLFVNMGCLSDFFFAVLEVESKALSTLGVCHYKRVMIPAIT